MRRLLRSLRRPVEARVVYVQRDPLPRVITIAAAWDVIEACSFRDDTDGTCTHEQNPTPECHGPICPLARVSVS